MDLVRAVPADAEAMIVADCDLAATGDKHVSARNVLADRRPDLYGAVTRAEETEGQVAS